MNKIIVTLSDYFWTKGVKVLDFIPRVQGHNKYIEAYVISDENPSMLMFFTGGSNGRQLSQQTDQNIIQDLESTVKRYLDESDKSWTITNYTITRWEKDPDALGSYTYYGVQTKVRHFKQFQTPLHERMYFSGEHVHTKQNSNVHGAFDSGLSAGVQVTHSLFEEYSLFVVGSLLLLTFTF